MKSVKIKKKQYVLFCFVLLFSILVGILISISKKKEVGSDFDKVNSLRLWASERIPWAYGSFQIKDIIKGKEAPQIFQYYKQNIGGVDCDGAAYSLMKLYKQHGYKSYAYHYGNLDGWNHVITLVEVNHKGKKIITVEDALFNVTYTYTNGTPIDFFDFLFLIKNNQEHLIIMKKNNNQKHYYFCDNRDTCPPPLDKNKIIKFDEHKVKYEVKTYFELLERNYRAFLIPRFLQGSIDGVGVRDMFDKIKNIVNK